MKPSPGPIDEAHWIDNDEIQPGDILVDEELGAIRVLSIFREREVWPTSCTVSYRTLPAPRSIEIAHESTVTIPPGMVFLASRIKQYTGRYWVGWYTQADEFRAPFREYHTGQTCPPDGERPWYTQVGLVDAPNPVAAFEKVCDVYPDAIPRFVNERPVGWSPQSDRFK